MRRMHLRPPPDSPEPRDQLTSDLRKGVSSQQKVSLSLDAPQSNGIGALMVEWNEIQMSRPPLRIAGYGLVAPQSRPLSDRVAGLP
jgi:hypothetical protein